jgi:hypothetical protein
MQIRNLEENCVSYVNTFSKTLRNAEPNSLKIRRTNAPSEIELGYRAPDDNRQNAPTYIYRLNTRDRMPEVRINGRMQSQYFGYLGNIDDRDHFRTVPNLYKIETLSGSRGSDPRLRTFAKNYITLSFSVEYTRDPTWRGQRTLSKTLTFSSAAYMINNNWPATKSGN